MIGAGTLSQRIRSTPPSFNELRIKDGEVEVRVRNVAAVPTPDMQITDIPHRRAAAAPNPASRWRRSTPSRRSIRRCIDAAH